MKLAYTAPGSEQSQTKRTDLASRVFDNPKFILSWMLFVTLIFIFVSIPIQQFLLVLWVYGKEGYFHQGIRVLPGKPIRFSDGVRVPQELDILTGFGMFMVTTFGLTAALFFSLRSFDRLFGKPQAQA
jgi:hypothetical protein